MFVCFDEGILRQIVTQFVVTAGQVEEEETGGEHSVFRYEKALFLGVNL